MNTNKHPLLSLTLRLVAGVLAVLLFVMDITPAAYAASSWKPTLLVNTESFQTIDEGDSTTDIEIRFGDTLRESIKYDRSNTRFKFSRGVFVGGNIIGTGTLSIKRNMSGASLRVDNGADIWGTLGVSGATTLKSTLTVNGNTKVRGNLSGASLRVDNGADVWGTLGVSGATVLKSTLTVNGNTKVRGNLSGASLRVDGNADIWGNLGVSGATIVRGAFTINGNLKVRGNMSGTSLRVDNGADIWGTLGVSGATTLKSTLTVNGNTKVRGNLSGASLRVDGNADIWGTLRSSGAIRTRSSISGSTLTIDGNVTFRNLTYSFPTSHGSNGYVLTNNGAGALTWSAASAGGVGSGEVVFMDPEYPNTTYFASGTALVSGSVGALLRDYDISNKRNYYRWTTTKTTNQAYWMATRVRVPTNFSAWQGSAPLQVAYRNSGAYLNVYLYDTAGAAVSLTGGSSLHSASPGSVPAWATATITGPESGGTYTANGNITILMQVVASGATAANRYSDVGHLQVNFKNTAP